MEKQGVQGAKEETGEGRRGEGGESWKRGKGKRKGKKEKVRKRVEGVESKG